ncbi:RING finger protein, putative [Pediculus humanus corporis]|uniref:RING finger protein, putative n=1 Tax=Pediculus humanus subsp. corporis TaxID=121224 RepID=E0VKM3_PEDHC|nr:RING finger protein, putative [Pediculus humanus corporis]EEB13929.1 RING finger protein, putative [Pediculus humanus corporis]
MWFSLFCDIIYSVLRSTSDDIRLIRENETNQDATSEQLGPPPTYQETISNQNLPIYYPSPNVSCTVSQLTEEEQVKIAKRIGYIQHLPTGVYDGCKKVENVYLHGGFLYCIDDWLRRSFTCPFCMEPVDAALLGSYETN